MEIPAEVAEFEKELSELLERRKIVISNCIVFPQYRVLPDEVELALKIINKHGGIIRLQYSLEKSEVK